MGILVPDERRRITLPDGFAEPGQKFVAIKQKGGILLRPVPRVTLETIQEEGKKLRGKTADIRKRARKDAEEEALHGLRRH